MAVSVQQASANAFAAWLQIQMPDVKVSSRWPSKDLPPKAITIVAAGARKDTVVDPRILKNTVTGDTNTTSVWQLAMCYQPYQLDVWTTNHVDRDDIMARLDTFLCADASALTNAFNPNPVGNGVLIEVLDGWDSVGTIADFDFDSPDIDDTPHAAQQMDYRATYRGGCRVMLSVTKVTARQKVINFQLLMNGETPFDTYKAP